MRSFLLLAALSIPMLVSAQTTVSGTVNDPAMHGEIRVTVIATGFDRPAPVEQPLGRVSGASGVISFQAQRQRASTPSQPSNPAVRRPWSR